MMMARPTTTSQAATTIVKNATTWPSRWPCRRENETEGVSVAESDGDSEGRAQEPVGAP